MRIFLAAVSLGALSVSSELFLDRLCEVVNEQLAKLDSSTSSGLPLDIKVWSFDWMAALSFPAHCEGYGRFNRVRRRMRAKAIWKLIVESVPSEDLVRKLISAALSDSQLPVKMDRFDQSIGHTLHGYAMNDNGAIETLTNLGFPEYLYESSGCVPSVYVNNNEAPNKRQMEAADLRIREEAKDAILEHVFMPLAERSFWSGLQLDLQESPQSRDRRNHLLAQDAALVRLIDELNRFRDGQHSNAQAPAGDGGSPAGAGRATPTDSSGRRRNSGRRRHPRGNPPQSPFGQSSSTFGGGSPFGGASPAPSGFTDASGGFTFGHGGPTFGASPSAAAPPAPGPAASFSFGGAPAPAPAPGFSFGAAPPAPPPAAPFSFGSR